MSRDPEFSPLALARLLGAGEPTPEQAAVIGAPLSPMAVIAGAGSGKSETMAARLVWLVANGHVSPERVLGLTFTRKAAAELAGRVRTRLDRLRRVGLTAEQSDEPVISTYHSYAGRLIADHALREALEPTMRLITPAVAWQLAAKVVASYDGPMDDVGWTPVTVTAAVFDMAAELAEHLRDPADVLAVGEDLRRMAAGPAAGSRAERVLACQRAREQIIPLVQEFRRIKAEREVIDYGDQIAIAARIALAHPEVGAAERARYQVVLLDEFQDTSHAQLELMRALFGGGHPVTAVGDPCQSIYGWRGASAGNLKRFTERFPPATIRPLSVSFRNAGRILDAAAAIQADLRAEVREVPRLIAPPERAVRGAVRCALHLTARGEAKWVAEQVAGLLALPPGLAPDGRPWPDGREASVRPSDIAVLCRKRVQFPALRSALEAAGIPLEVVGLGGLLTVPEVADIVATLRVLHYPDASDSLARILTSPRWRIGPRDLVALGNRARLLARHQAAETSVKANDHLDAAVADFTTESGSLVEALDDLGHESGYSTEGYSRLRALAAELRDLRRHASRPLPELVTEVERALGLDVEVAARAGGAAQADLDAFADAAAAFAGDAELSTLGAFLAYLAAAETEEFGLEAGQVSEADTVKLATVHSAKGLQWPAVIVPGLAADLPRAGVFPARPPISGKWTDNARLLPFWLRGDASDLPVLRGLDGESLAAFGAGCADRHLAEERRLAYVAVTRAAYWLGCSGYWWGAGRRPLGPSPFLDEVRAACQAGAGEVSAWADPPGAGAENPALAAPLTATWPGFAGQPPGGADGPADRYAAVREAGDLVRTAMAATGMAAEAAAAAEAEAAAAAEAEAALAAEAAAEAAAAAEAEAADRTVPVDVPSEYAGLVAGWAADADLLLAERARRLPDGPVPVHLPQRIGVSALVAMARDPAGLATRIRRPMPASPAPRAEQGTAFHRWLEERFGQARLIDRQELAGAADSDLVADDADLAALKAAFERGRWGKRWPAVAEVPFETRIGDRLVRGRIDAVFADDPRGGYDVVDWKTGRPPRPGSDEERAVAVQLAAYRLAWAALAGVALEKVRAAFYYVREDRTVRPADLLEATGLAALIESLPAE